MPCYQIRITSVEFLTRNIAMLTSTVKALGWQITTKDGEHTINTGSEIIAIKNGRAEGNTTQINKLRVGYSNAIVSVAAQQAKAKGWNVRTVNNKLEVWK